MGWTCRKQYIEHFWERIVIDKICLLEDAKSFLGVFFVYITKNYIVIYKHRGNSKKPKVKEDDTKMKKLICQIVGHSYREIPVKLREVIKNEGLKFNPMTCSEVVEGMKRNGEDPLLEHECVRCGKKKSYVNKFLNLYRG